MSQAKKFIFLTISLVALSSLLVSAAGRQARSKGRGKVGKMTKEMLAAREAQTQIPCLTKTYGSFSVEQAYRIQAALAKGLSKKLGSVAGYKVAYASKAAQEQFGVDEPASGPLFRLQRVPNGSKLPAGVIMEITLETEIAFTIGKRIDRAIENVQELKSHVKWVHTAFDIGDYRFVSGEESPTPADQIASGVGAHFFVLGPAVAPSEVDVDSLTLKLARNGKTIRESAATNVMGSPWNSLLWLANHVVKRGGALEPGHVVVSGTAAPAYKVKGDEIKGEYVGDCGPLGKVTMTLY
ncbi:MAG: 2-keto-4-pentenoate hydratase [Planctomycetota bacterium]|jgi:2-keto-4-pentenoate hydratase